MTGEPSTARVILRQSLRALAMIAITAAIMVSCGIHP